MDKKQKCQTKAKLFDKKQNGTKATNKKQKCWANIQIFGQKPKRKKSECLNKSTYVSRLHFQFC